MTDSKPDFKIDNAEAQLLAVFFALTAKLFAHTYDSKPELSNKDRLMITCLGAHFGKLLTPFGNNQDKEPAANRLFEIIKEANGLLALTMINLTDPDEKESKKESDTTLN